MTAKDLKKALLQEAVQGKLVPQILSEGNARDLLEEIRKEKVKLIKEGKIKKEKLLPEITEEEIPFDIPESWCWCRLSDIGEISRGRSKHRPRNDPILYENGSIPFIQTGDVANANRIILKPKTFYNQKGLEQSRLWKKGTICLTIAANIGDVAELDFDACFPDSVVGFNGFVKISDNKYVMYALMWYKDLLDKLSHSTAQKNINLEILTTVPFPLPPLAEQKRIVAAIEKFMPLIEEYGKKETELKALNEQIGTLTKKAILQEAVQGKLVPQIAAEGNAKELLEKIKKEKAKLVKEGKIKKEKPLTEITEDEIPFDIPESWCWCLLKDIADVFYGFPLDSSKFNCDNNGKMIVRIRDIKTAISNTYTTEEIPQAYHLHKNDMLVGMDGNFNVNFWPIEGALLNQRVCKITTKATFYEQKFLFYILPMFLDEISENVSYCTVKHLSDKHLSSMYLPLPPLAEQKRIVAAIEKILPLCARLSSEQEKLGE